jgi:hypothetical protein
LAATRNRALFFLLAGLYGLALLGYAAGIK